MTRLSSTKKLSCLILLVALLSLSLMSLPASAASSLAMSLSGTSMPSVQAPDIQNIEEPAIGDPLFPNQRFVLSGTGFLDCGNSEQSINVFLLTEATFVPATAVSVYATGLEFTIENHVWQVGGHVIVVNNGCTQDSVAFNVSSCDPAPGFLRDP